jgi:aspartyl-tRNA(Asn)/glutamyl-tRNA(Gln) amidotransferase subunit C
MKKLSKKQVIHIAKLSRIDLSNQEIKKFQNQLSDVLEYVSQIQELNLPESQEYSVLDLKNIFREDKITENWQREKLMGNAPKQKDGFFVVPSVFKKK